jgi:hypothetical protein
MGKRFRKREEKARKRVTMTKHFWPGNDSFILIIYVKFMPKAWRKQALNQLYVRREILFDTS